MMSMVSEMSKNLNGMANFGGCLTVVCMFIIRLLIGGVGSKITPNVLYICVCAVFIAVEVSAVSEVELSVRGV